MLHCDGYIGHKKVFKILHKSSHHLYQNNYLKVKLVPLQNNGFKGTNKVYMDSSSDTWPRQYESLVIPVKMARVTSRLKYST